MIFIITKTFIMDYNATLDKIFILRATFAIYSDGKKGKIVAFSFPSKVET